jgi:hypothetical protein
MPLRWPRGTLGFPLLERERERERGGEVREIEGGVGSHEEVATAARRLLVRRRPSRRIR